MSVSRKPNNKLWQRWEEKGRSPECPARGNINSHCEYSMGVSLQQRKRNLNLTYDCFWVFTWKIPSEHIIETLMRQCSQYFTEPKHWNQPICPLAEKWGKRISIYPQWDLRNKEQWSPVVCRNMMQKEPVTLHIWIKSVSERQHRFSQSRIQCFS